MPTYTRSYWKRQESRGNTDAGIVTQEPFGNGAVAPDASVNVNEAVAPEASVHEDETVVPETPHKTEAVGSEGPTPFRTAVAGRGDTLKCPTVGQSSNENDQKKPQCPMSTPTMSDTKDEGTASSIQSSGTPTPENNRKRKFRDMVAWGNSDYEKQTTFDFESTWETAQIQWPKIASKWLSSKDPKLVAAGTAFEKTMTEMIELEAMDPAAASRLNGAWKKHDRKLMGKVSQDRFEFRRVLETLESYGIVLAAIREHPYPAERKDESKDKNYRVRC